MYAEGHYGHEQWGNTLLLLFMDYVRRYGTIVCEWVHFYV